jgi:diphthine-ammonia ligase
VKNIDVTANKTMKFVALVSGGKDSCFNILHCIRNGHTLEALANLYPPPQHGSDELDSFMYQTVGYHAVALYGACLGVPLYRKPISGTSVSQSLSYSPTKDDESEDLFMLLQDVQKNHPDLEAVSVGAILSTYQRTRVENVCQRLGLVCLSFLWKRSQSELLDEIIDSGLDARIIKTAGIGLNRSHLGKSLAQMRPLLTKLNQTYGLHLCGEGGEYETLVLDGPIFKKRLVILNSHTVDHSSGDVSYLSVEVGLEEKTDAGSLVSLDQVKVPPLLEDAFQELHDSVKLIHLPTKTPPDSGIFKPPACQTFATSSTLFVCNVVSKQAFVEAEVHQVFQTLQKILDQHQMCFENLVFISLLVADMKEFKEINSAYSTFFTGPNPPARFCIQTPGLGEHRVRLSAMAVVGPREALHIQSQSYWAPANIGPYSQAVTTNGITYLAGQIALIPASMQLAEDCYLQVALSLQNISRVMEATQTGQAASTVAFVASSSSTDISYLAEKAWNGSCGLLVAGVPRLPRNGAIEWCCVGINDDYHIQAQPDDDEHEHEKFVWPPMFSSTSQLDVASYGWSTTITCGLDSVESLDKQLKECEDKYGNIISATIYATSDTPCQLPGEIIPVEWLIYRSSHVKVGAVITFRRENH